MPPPHLPKSLTKTLIAYLGAIGCVGMALGIELLFTDVFKQAPFFLFWPAVATATWFGGIRPGLLATVLSVFCVNYFFLSPERQLDINSIDLLLLGLFTVSSIFIAWLSARHLLTETALREHQQYLHAILFSIGDGVIVTDAEGQITYINPVAAQLTGWAETEVLGQGIGKVFRIINESTRQPVPIPILQALEKGVMVNITERALLITKSGLERSISDSSAPIHNRDGKTIGAVLVFHDITEQRQTEMALQASEERYRDLVESASDLIYTLDLDGNFTSINPAGEALTGYAPTELINTPIMHLVTSDYVTIMRQMFENKLQSSRQPTYELDIKTKSGEYLTLEVSSRLAYSNQQPVGIQGIGRDITERKRAAKLNQILQTFAIELAGAITTQQATDVILKTLLETMDGQFSAIFRLSEDRQQLERVGAQGLDTSYIQKYPSLPLEGDFPISQAVRTHQILWIRDQAEYLRLYPHLAQDIHDLNAQEIICLPFFGSKGIVGGVYVTFNHTREIDEEERNFLFVVAQVCGQALERVQLYEKTEQVADQLRQLYTVTSALAQAATLEEVAYIAVEKTTSVLEAASASFHLYDEKAGAFEMIYTNANLPPENLAGWQRYNADPAYPITQVAQTKIPLWFTSGAERESRYPSMGEYGASFIGASALLPMIIQGQVLAVLSLRFAKPKEFNAVEQALASAIVQQCAQVLKRVQLNEQAKQAIALEERQRFARDLHDSVSQTLYAATTLGESLPRLWERDPAQIPSMVEQIVTLNRAALAEMRLLLWELRPEAILKSSLQDLFRHLLEAAQGRQAIDADLSIEGYDNALPTEVHIALYRITQESINNILKHSQSTHFSVTLQQQPDVIRLQITDNGQGFDPTQNSAGLGLSSMQERAREIGATLAIESQSGQGTVVKVIWPRTTPNKRA